MRLTFRHQSGLLLATLAVSLQIVVAVLGGSVCIRPSAAAVVTPPSCASACCESAVVPAANGEALPFESDCCFDVPDLLAEARAASDVRDVSTIALAFTVPAPLGAPNGNMHAVTPSETHPPPDLAFVRVTVLRV